MMSREVCLCIHGHFYQPPRENPWTGEIGEQPSAHPYHDWNERIYHECYLPNTEARILDTRGALIKTVNNFEKISFNVGPTLFSWLEGKHPEIYHRILDADSESGKRHKGHGNAMAQVYNHMIMPLANLLDKTTQVRWGIKEFKYRYGREPEGMWLPETACDEETLEVLIDEGIKFTILAPHQAEAVGVLETEEWRDVSQETLNTKIPYRCFLGKHSHKFIDLFFYDGAVAKEVAFGDLAFEAKKFADFLERVKSKDHRRVQLIHVATDGETFGHHKAFGERALAYLLEVKAPKQGFHLVNYGEFLEDHPPHYAVRFNEGEDGEG
ncbi:MAG: glycoside hydrolase, partial [Candidatus Omnitrophica bacterium]|nr:glycoside hydrolase [Candidatus Omnitrophota bacterium]